MIEALGLEDRDVADRLHDMAELAVHATGMDLAFIAMLDAERAWIATQTISDSAAIQRRLPGCLERARGSGFFVLANGADPDRDAGAVAGLGFCVGVTVGLEPGGDAVGALCVGRRGPLPDGLSAAAARRLRQLAGLVETQLRERLLASRLQRAEADQRENSAEAEVMKRVAGTGVALLDAEGRFVEVNPYVARLLDTDPCHLIGRSFLETTPESDRESLVASFRRSMDGGLRIRGEWPIQAHDGTLRRARISSERITRHGQPMVLSVITDVSQEYTDHTLRRTQARLLEQVALERPLADFLGIVPDAVLEHRPGAGVLVAHIHHGRLELESRSASGAGMRRFLQGLPRTLTVGPWCEAVRDNAPVFLRGGDAVADWGGELASAPDAGVRGVWAFPLRATDGHPLGCLAAVLASAARPAPWEREFLGELADLAGFALERQDRIEVLREQALYDPLTGLANRVLLRDRLRGLLLQDQRRGTATAALMLDLDDFKRINDTYGHAAGDELLVDVAERIATTLRESDAVARLGGDEFVAVLGAADRAAAEEVAGKLLRAFSEALTVEGKAQRVRPSVGIALSHPGELDGEALLERADAAMYEAKRAGKGTYRVAP